MTAADTAVRFDVDVEDDPTPFVLALAHVLRLARNHHQTAERLATLGGVGATVAVVVIDTPRKATISFNPTGLTVTHGLAEQRTGLVHVSADSRYTIEHAEPDTLDGSLVNDIAAVLNPPLPDWQNAAHEFWGLTHNDAGMPAQLVAVSTDGQRLELGSGTTVYEIHAPADDLQRLFCGIDSFYDLLIAGKLRIRGSMAQMSVMSGASWKVQHHG